ncbi:helix-turn-helix transcriptional regulator [Oscillibacter sp.]|uniref:helix-turn-helix domain-containing protein n=1 Tax=Oscillibacter sp. TaxID=1945593 RepID=UPI00289EB86E|nr:helix-turn-helix transcriptional regulator [Oscillibacter sp.]
MNVVGANITKIRLDKGLKQKELLAKLQSEGMEITGSCLSKIEGQTKMVTDKDLLIIAKALGVKPEDLL